MKKKTDCPFGATSDFFSYRSNSRVVAILFKNNLEFKVKNYIWDTKGNFLILDVQIENKDFLLVSLYRIEKKTYSNQHIIITR